MISDDPPIKSADDLPFFPEQLAAMDPYGPAYAAKVDELMVLCDELEAAQAKRERRRARLVAATLPVRRPLVAVSLPAPQLSR